MMKERNDERKEGRKERRKEGRKEGRKERRKEAKENRTKGSQTRMGEMVRRLKFIVLSFHLCSYASYQNSIFPNSSLHSHTINTIFFLR